jgi:dTDP-4-dehydrorhamnose reductase
MTADIVIFGASGQVARAWAAVLGPRARAFSHREIDLADADFIGTLDKKWRDAPVRAVINAAAYTNVRQAESEEASALRVNGEAVGELAAWCKKRGAALVHYSTDYVFGDDDNHFHTETEPPHPLNAYGRSKLAGERAIENAGGNYLIFRTSWVYDAAGKNFFNTMLGLFRENEQVDVVGDQFGAPTYAPTLAEASNAALSKAFEAKSFPSGVYHLCHGGETSWCGFAQAIFALARSHDSGIRCQRVNPISTAARADPVKRPRNSRLNCSKAKEIFGVELPQWEEGVRQCIEKKYEDSRLQHSRPQAHSRRGE